MLLQLLKEFETKIGEPVLDSALNKTLQNITESVGGKPTVLWTGNGVRKLDLLLSLMLPLLFALPTILRLLADLLHLSFFLYSYTFMDF
jgi:hypothetical protein